MKKVIETIRNLIQRIAIQKLLAILKCENEDIRISMAQTGPGSSSWSFLATLPRGQRWTPQMNQSRHQSVLQNSKGQPKYHEIPMCPPTI